MDVTQYKTSAQTITAIAYNEETRCLDFKVGCKDITDLFDCIKIIGQYNNFDAENVINAFSELVKAIEDTEKTGKSVFIKYHIGREGSPVLYIDNYSSVKIENYHDIISNIAKNAKADECEKKILWENLSSYRLWWD